MFVFAFASLVLLSVFAKNIAQLSAAQSNRAPRIFHPKANWAVQENVNSNCLDCICQQETTGCNHNEQCNANGTICGPFQINSDYFHDCCTFLNLGNCDSYSAFRTCATDYNCAARCVSVSGAGRSIFLLFWGVGLT